MYATSFILSPREYERLSTFVNNSITDDPRYHQSPILPRKLKPGVHDHHAAAFRSASRVYLLTAGTLKVLEKISIRLSQARSPGKTTAGKPLVASGNKLALSLASLLYFHRTLYRLFTRLRLQLLHERVREIRKRYPKTYAALTSRLAPAVGASLSGLALGICPKDQLRVTVAIYVIVRALELAYAAADAAGLTTHKPWWVGSWMLFACAQGQLLHAFVFDRDCFPAAYGSFVLQMTPEYIQKRPQNLSSKVEWPSSWEIVDNLAQMARLRWPPFVSPILRPQDKQTLPLSINPVISPITSRAHPVIQHLSCALLHPHDTSCFTPFLRQVLLSFSKLARFFTLYYGAVSLLQVRLLLNQPAKFLDQLSKRILKVTTVVCGSIAGSWASICFFNNYLPRSFMPRLRFFLGGALSGSVAIIDRSSTGHENAMYATRTSINSLWKVGVKHKWWKGIRGGDVYVFVVALAMLNVVYDLQRSSKRHARTEKDAAMRVMKLLRGEVEVGMQEKKLEKD